MGVGSGALGFGGGFARGFANQYVRNQETKRQQAREAEDRKFREYQVLSPLRIQHAEETGDWRGYQEWLGQYFPDLNKELKKGGGSPFETLAPLLQAAPKPTAAQTQMAQDQADAIAGGLGGQPELPSRQSVQPDVTPAGAIPDPRSMLFGSHMPTPEERARRAGRITAEGERAKLDATVEARRALAQRIGLTGDEAARYVLTGQVAAEPGETFKSFGNGGIYSGKTGEIVRQPDEKPSATEKLGSFEDYVARTYGANPTAAQILKARKDYFQADDRAAATAAADRKQAVSDLRQRQAEAVIANPSLWNDLPPTVKAEIAPDLAAKGFEGFGKPLSDSAVSKLSEARSAIESLRDLRQVLKDNEQYIGPVAGLSALNPYSEARQAKSRIDTVRQRVGKALEGGVLRKEDEQKYKSILATLTDTPETAIYKTDNLIKDLERDIQVFIDQERAAGRKVNNTPIGGAKPTHRYDPATGGLTPVK